MFEKITECVKQLRVQAPKEVCPVINYLVFLNPVSNKENTDY